MLQELERVSLDISYVQQGVVVKLSGVLSLTTAPDFKKRILGLIEEGASSVSLEISEIKHIDSVGLATLIILSRTCIERSVQFHLLHPAPMQDHLLRTTSLAKYLTPQG